MADGRYIFRDCVPDGAIDIVNVRTGYCATSMEFQGKCSSRIAISP